MDKKSNPMNDHFTPSQQAASALGKLAKGVPKTITEQDRERRRRQAISAGLVRMEKIRKKNQSDKELEHTIELNAKKGVFTPIQSHE